MPDKVQCYMCGGDGKLADGEECETCGGKGVMDEEDMVENWSFLEEAP